MNTYQKPVLRRHGSVEEMTKATTTGGRAGRRVRRRHVNAGRT